MFEPFTPVFFRRLQQLKIRTRRSFLGSRQGSHRSLRKGHGLEFADYRGYVPGDDFRYIDWGVYGRTDRVYVREFREEQDLNIMVLLDTSTSMGYPEGAGKFELARDLALALGYIALTDGDTVTFSLLGQRNTARFSGQHALGPAAKELREAKPGGNFDLLAEIRGAVARHRIPGKCFFISDFLIELEDQYNTLDYLRAKNFELCLVQVLAPAELALEIEQAPLVVDAESGEVVEMALDRSSRQEYAKQLSAHLSGLERYCAKAGIPYLLVSSTDTVFNIVLTKLPELGVLK